MCCKRAACCKGTCKTVRERNEGMIKGEITFSMCHRQTHTSIQSLCEMQRWAGLGRVEHVHHNRIRLEQIQLQRTEGGREQKRETED